MSRRQARELLMKIIFQMEAQKDGSDKKMELLLKDRDLNEEDDSYIRDTFHIYRKHKNEIDALINDCSPRWKVNRMPKADLAILRLAICEAKFCDQIPVAVAISEAVDLAKRYGSDHAPAFINGVAGKAVNG